MRKRLISICIIGILLCGIYKYAQIAEAPIANPVIALEYIDERVRIPAPAADSPIPQEEPEPEKKIDFDGSNTHLSILMEYEWAWEDETYTVEEWQDVAGVFMTLTEGWSADDYTLYYSISDLSGDGTEELIIGVQGEDGIAPCFLYTCDGERIHMTDSRTGSDLVNIPTILYDNGVIESMEYIKYGMYRYNFYQRPEKPRDQGGMELIDLYFYIEDPGNGTQYYKGDMANIIAEEEFWSAINEYESLPQIELNWHELDGFWESDEDGAKTIISEDEYSHREKEEPEDEAESAAIEEDDSKRAGESKNSEPVTVVTKATSYSGENLSGWSEYEYDSAGNLLGWKYYNADGSFRWRKEYEYDRAGNPVKLIWYDVNGVIIDCNEYRRYDSAGNQVEYIHYYEDGRISVWYEYEYDGAGNQTKQIDYWGKAGSHYGREYGSLAGWYEYEYDSAGNQVKQISYYSDGCINWWREYEYESTGNLMSVVTHNGNGSKYRWWHEYEFDSNGNKTRDTEYDEYSGHDDPRVMKEYEYDSEGNLTKMIEHSGENWSRTEYEYITITPQ